MKTSLLLIAATLAASLSQAASLNWTISTVPEASSGYTAMLFMTAQNSSADGFVNFGKANTTLAKVTELADAGDYDGLVALAAATRDATANIANQPTGYNGNNFAAGDSVTAFALIVNAAKDKYFTTDSRSQSWTSGTGGKALAFGSQANATYKSFGAVPEPATGALALAGVALLFRRRRA